MSHKHLSAPSFFTPRLILVAVAVCVPACDSGDDGGEEATSADAEGSTESGDDGWTTGSDTGVTLGDIDVTVEYAGAATGGVTVGAFISCPPENPPVSFRRISEPVYPLEVTLVDIESGSYCVYAYIDEAPENPTFPGPEDPQGYSENLMVDGDNPATTITMLDPMP